MEKPIKAENYAISKDYFLKNCDTSGEKYIYYEYYNTDDLNAKKPSITHYKDKDDFIHLATELIAKNMNKCSWIKSIRRIQRYTHIEIIVTYDHGGVSKYYLYNCNV